MTNEEPMRELREARELRAAVLHQEGLRPRHEEEGAPMICDNCAWREGCKDRKGKHEQDCAEYFPDLDHAKPTQPGRYATLEKRLQLKKREGKA